MNEVLLTKKDLSRLMKCSERTLDRLRRDGVLRSFQVNRIVRFRWSDVQEFFSKNARF